MLDVLTIGDIKLDTFIVVDDASVQCGMDESGCKLCLDYGRKIPVNEIQSQVAGSAPNIAVGLARMKLKTAVVSEMGRDATYLMAKDFLKKHKVSTAHVKSRAGRDSSFAAVLNYRGESTQLVAHSDASYRFSGKPRSAWVHVSELGKGYAKLYDDLLKVDARISLNPGEVQILERKRSLMRLLKNTDVLFLNRREAREILRTQEDEIRPLMVALKKLGPAYVVVTDGRAGAYAFDGEQLDFAPMFPGERVEATGAGDAFATGFLGALVKGKNHETALRWGSVNAAEVVQHVGPTEGLLSHGKIARALKARPSYKTKEI